MNGQDQPLVEAGGAKALFSRRLGSQVLLQCAAILITAEALSHVFIWTYLGEVKHERIVQSAVLAAFGGSLSAIFLLVVDRYNMFRSPAGKERRILAVVLYFLAITVVLWLVNWTMMGWITLSELVEFSFRTGGLSTLSFASVCWLLGLVERNGPLSKAAAVFFGLIVTCALLGDGGTIWLAVFLIPAAVVPVLLRRLGRIEFSSDKLVPNWLALVVCALIWQGLFGDFDLGWDLAVLAVAVLTCVFAVRLAALSWWNDEPTVRHAQLGPELRRGKWRERIAFIPRAVGVGSGDVLVVAWVALLFNLFYWTEPSFWSAPAAPFAYEIPEPSRPEWTPGSNLSMSEIWAHKSAEMSRYTHRKFQQDLDRSTHYQISQEVAFRNDVVSGEIYARRWIKGIALILVPLLTRMYMVRINSSTKAVLRSATTEALAPFAVANGPRKADTQIAQSETGSEFILAVSEDPAPLTARS